MKKKEQGTEPQGRMDPAGPAASCNSAEASQPAAQAAPPQRPDQSAAQARLSRSGWRWWLRLLLQPLLLAAAGVVLLLTLAALQRVGLISASGGGSGPVAQQGAEPDGGHYICPMMCTPPRPAPGRCPVCGMELVKATSTGGDGDQMSVSISPTARRVAHIATAPVQRRPFRRKVRTIGSLSYDEGRLATIAAYVDGRIERLYADYTGFYVPPGYRMALIYSPELYAAQEEFLQAILAVQQINGHSRSSFVETQRQLLSGSRQKLIELGMTEQQIDQLQRRGEASSRIDICAPIGGTVIEKLAVEGQYVKEGQPLYRIADLSSIWLLLELFPDDAAALRYGQRVEAEVQSLPGRKFVGRVVFIAPTVNPKTRTVSVRVVLANPDGLLRVGDYATATIQLDLVPGQDPRKTKIYDPDLAGKWISPRHPHVIQDGPGKCSVCGCDLVPASQYGFSDKPVADQGVLVVPRDAVLMAGHNSVVYVETEPGRFELRRVVLGPSNGDEMVILSGVEEGEQVAVRGNFLIDSQMQLAGNPSLIDPTKVDEAQGDSKAIQAALAALSPEDQQLAKRQRICPVTGMPLGSMGTPVAVTVKGRRVLLCCPGCKDSLLKEPEKHLAKLDDPAAEESDQPPAMDLPPAGGMQAAELPAMAVPQINVASPDDQAAAIARALSQLPPADRAAAQRQKICPVTGMPLGSMGTPIKVDVQGRVVFICCEGCRDALLSDPVKYLAKLPQKESDR